MAEIKVKIAEINNAITKLQGLQSRCNSRNTTAPATVGGGKAVNEIEEIAKVYKSLNTSFSGLLANTISFLKNVENSYSASDKKAASGILKGGGGSSGGTGSTRNF